MLRQDSPFLNPGSVAKANQLAIIQLSKDDLTPVYLRDTEGEHDGYKEGHVLNTRFGSFPHSTLIGVPWGTQVRASNVDTGSRGRKSKSKEAKGLAIPDTATEDDYTGAKRKRGPNDEGEKRAKGAPDQPAAAVENTTAEQGQKDTVTVNVENHFKNHAENDQKLKATQKSDPSRQPQKQQKTTTARSGFVYILPPTPETWTSSLPHRTQVVYTPDYSYVLQRIRARPGSRLIEAGSGSGSFTHASARAVYDGETGACGSPAATGKVFSFEFHEQRFEKMRKEISEHGLSQMVEINHRDVYKDGFLVDGKSPEADAVFLDLPAPWLALPHLSRRKVKTGLEMEGIQTGIEGGDENWISPLNPKKSAYICTFSPCIEQVTRTVSEMRKLGWVEIEMIEIAHKRINVFREKIGLNVVSDRGAQQAPGDVAEALAKLKEIEIKTAEHNAKMFASNSKTKKEDEDEDMDDYAPVPQTTTADGAAQKPNRAEEDAKKAAVKPFLQGRLVTRPEAETKAHTSYLVFAILPREWTEEDEAAAAAKWPIGQEPPKTIGAVDRAARKQQRRELMQSSHTKNQKMKNNHTPRSDPTMKPAEALAPEQTAQGPGGGQARDGKVRRGLRVGR